MSIKLHSHTCSPLRYAKMKQRKFGSTLAIALLTNRLETELPHQAVGPYRCEQEEGGRSILLDIDAPQMHVAKIEKRLAVTLGSEPMQHLHGGAWVCRKHRESLSGCNNDTTLHRELWVCNARHSLNKEHADLQGRFGLSSKRWKAWKPLPIRKCSAAMVPGIEACLDTLHPSRIVATYSCLLQKRHLILSAHTVDHAAGMADGANDILTAGIRWSINMETRRK